MRVMRTQGFHRRSLVLGAAAVMVATLLGAPAAAGPEMSPEFEPTLNVTVLVDGLANPWDLAQAPDGTLLFNERGGGLTARLPNGTLNAVSANLGDLFAEGETGLMGLVLDPAFAQNRRFYTCQGHEDASGREIQVIAWTMNAAWTAAIRVNDPLVGGIPVNMSGEDGRHGGCRLRFDTIGALMIGTGDAATGTVPQDLESLGGKVLRVNAATGAPAAGNPALGAPHPNTRLIYNYGHRNIQGLALRADGKMFNVEHGTFRDDEVNVVRPGRNYGWDPVGGDGYNELAPMTDLNKFPNAVEASWSSGPTSTTATSGATFLAGSQWGSWRHSMVVAELKAMQLRLITFDRTGTVLLREFLIPELDGTFGRLRTAQLGTDGALYITTSNRVDDKIIRVTAGP